MPGSYINPHGSTVVANTIGRVERIERKTNAPTPNTGEKTIFSYPGPLSPNVTSPPWYPTVSGNIEFIRFSLLAAATTTHTIGLNVNGNQLATFSLSAGQSTAVFGGNFYPVQYNQPITISTVAVTDSNMTVEVHVR